MGCLNAGQGFGHWFANIHLSGPCNRACYFCIGQHMMALDSHNVLDTWPLPGWDEFIAKCREQNVEDINLTGTNTDPLLYKHLPELVTTLREEFPGVTVGVRTNGVHLTDDLYLFNKASVSITSFNEDIYRRTMGMGSLPDLARILRTVPRVKVNVVLCRENTEPYLSDLWDTLRHLRSLGVRTVNLREPYGQPHIGDPLRGHLDHLRVGDVFGMPSYNVFGMHVTYWDVHYVEVESVNLYASGRVSVTYPITLGHADTGVVLDQSHFAHGRHRAQWVDLRI